MYRELYTDIANDLGATITFTEDWGTIGYISLPNGHNIFFKGQDIGLNSSAISEIMYDKAATTNALKTLGFNAPEHLLYFSPAYIEKISTSDFASNYNTTKTAQIDHFIGKHGFPLFIKPNKGSKGRDVIQVDNRDDLLKLLSDDYNVPQLSIIQEPCEGAEFRIVVLNGQIMLAYQKQPLEIEGDGQKTIRELVKNRLSFLKDSGRAIELDIGSKLEFSLAALEYSASTVLPAGQKLQPLANNNLSQGAMIIDVTEHVCPAYHTLCKKLAEKTGLGFFGLDLMCSGLDSYDPNYKILEVNDTPGFKNFVELDIGNRQKVKNIFAAGFKILSTRFYLGPREAPEPS